MMKTSKMILLNWKFFIINLLIILQININNVKSEQEEIFTSISDMESMISTESILIEQVQNYINVAELKINNLKRMLTEYRFDYTDLSQKLNQSNEVLKSVAVYKILSKFTKRFFQLDDIVEENLENVMVKNVTELKKSLKFPTLIDLSGAVLGLARLRNVYNLGIGNFSKLGSNSFGESNIIEEEKLDHTDYYLVGLHLFNAGEFTESEPWLRESFNSFKETSKVEAYGKVTKTQLMEMLSWVYYKQKNYDLAIYYATELLKIKTNLLVKNNLKEFYKERHSYVGSEAFHKNNDNENEQQEFLSNAMTTYKSGCRNELKRSPKILSHLQCWYLYETNDFLRYARVKIEEINFNPEMFIFHDVIYDSEIKALQKFAKGKLIPAKVWDTKINNEYKADYRTNKLAWLNYDSDPIVGRIKQRIGQMTGLSMETSENLQIANYGIGGHYEPHHDFHYDPNQNAKVSYPGSEWGNRLATLIFYLTDVKSGGATVFPLLNITVFPQKGSALFWYNLFSTGAGDFRTFHAACPVLEGDKWILNQWIHEREQEFNRPCALKKDDYQ